MNEHETAPAGSSESQAKEVHHHHYHKGPEFNFGRLLFGLLIILVGLAYLGRSLGWLPASFAIDWSVIWPIAIILLGLSLLSGRGWPNILFGLLASLVVLWVVVMLFFARPLGWQHMPMMPYFYSSSTDFSWRSDEAASKKQNFRIERLPDARRAAVTVQGGAGEIRIQGGTDYLIEGEAEAPLSQLATSTELEAGTQTASISTGFMPMMMGRWSNRLAVALSPALPMELAVESGAADLEIDATRLVLERLDIKSGASSLKLALGDKPALSQVAISAGASAIEIELSQTVGARVVLRSALTAAELDGFDKLDSQTYQTAGYDKAAKKIDLVLDLGASSLEVKRK